MNLKITYADIDKLIPYIRNARTHSDEQIALIAGSIREFGFTNPILVDGNHGVIAGHGRLLAARKLGMNVVPTIELAELSDAQKRAYVIADNQLAIRAGWNMEMLAGELHSLNGEGFELALLGFNLEQIDQLMAPTGEEGGYSSFLDDMAKEIESESLDGADEEEISPPPGWVSLSFAMEPDDRDKVLAYLGNRRDEMGLDTAAQALIAISIKA